MHVLVCIIAPSGSINVCIASLEAKEGVLYAGLENGTILCIHCTEMEVTLTFGAYSKSIRSLMILSPPPINSIPKVTKPQTAQQTYATYNLRRKPPPQRLPLQNISPKSRRKRFLHSCSVNTQSFDLSPMSFKVNSSYRTAEDLLLVSIGQGYKGIVGSNTNHPKDFILPSAMVTELQSGTQPAKSDPNSSCLLIWSTEKCGGGEKAEMKQESFETSVEQECCANE